MTAISMFLLFDVIELDPTHDHPKDDNALAGEGPFLFLARSLVEQWPRAYN